MIDPGVADVPEDDEYEADQDPERIKEEPFCVARAVAARECADLNRKLPRLARGMDVYADDVIEANDNNDWVPADVPPVEPIMTIKTEQEDILEGPEQFQEVLRRGQRNHVQRVPFAQVMEGQRYKEVGLLQTEDFRGDAAISEEIFQPGGAEELNSLHADEHVPDGTHTRNASYLGEVRAKREVKSHGKRDQGMCHPPRNRVKVDHERESWTGMYSLAGNVGCRDTPPRSSPRTCRRHVVSCRRHVGTKTTQKRHIFVSFRVPTRHGILAPSRHILLFLLVLALFLLKLLSST